MDNLDNLDKIRSGIQQVVAQPLIHRKGDNQIYQSSGVHSLTRDTARIFDKKKQRMAKVQKLRATSINPMFADHKGNLEDEEEEDKELERGLFPS